MSRIVMSKGLLGDYLSCYITSALSLEVPECWALENCCILPYGPLFLSVFLDFSPPTQLSFAYFGLRANWLACLLLRSPIDLSPGPESSNPLQHAVSISSSKTGRHQQSGSWGSAGLDPLHNKPDTSQDLVATP